jgi:hypothetical protein
MLTSPRTKKYYEALAREGDQFDYEAWLTRVRREEAEEKAARTKALGLTEQAAERSSSSLHGATAVPPPPRGRSARANARFSREPEKVAQSAAKSLGAALFAVGDTWDRSTENRYRDSIYVYLKAVYALVRRCKREGNAKELLCTAIRIAGLAADEDADLFAAVIRATCDDKLDQKMVSKYSRALRYAAHRDRPPRMLIEFIKRRGGINAVAERYARKMGRGGKAK